jgi:hypothetical protein
MPLSLLVSTSSFAFELLLQAIQPDGCCVSRFLLPDFSFLHFRFLLSICKYVCSLRAVCVLFIIIQLRFDSHPTVYLMQQYPRMRNMCDIKISTFLSTVVRLFFKFLRCLGSFSTFLESWDSFFRTWRIYSCANQLWIPVGKVDADIEKAGAIVATEAGKVRRRHRLDIFSAVDVDDTAAS